MSSKKEMALDLLDEMEKYARSFIGIYLPDYRFKWNKNKYRWGYCHYDKKEISMSAGLILLNPEEFNDTLRHEVAHGLIKDLDRGHGYHWKMRAIELGAKPQSCKEIENKLPHKYELVCNNCKRVVQKRYRRMSDGRVKNRHTLCCKSSFHQRPATAPNLEIAVPTFDELNIPSLPIEQNS